jgi:hypothetical protein
MQNIIALEVAVRNFLNYTEILALVGIINSRMKRLQDEMKMKRKKKRDRWRMG